MLQNNSLVKQIFLLVLCISFFSISLYAQSGDSLSKQTIDSVSQQADSVQVPQITAGVDSVKKTDSVIPVFKAVNQLLNSKAKPVSLAMQIKKKEGKDILFYIIAGLILFLAFLKYIYSRYFTNLVRVFFNTSLKQSQLTDQLLQAKLPSLLFNSFFVISTGLYVYTLLSYLHVFKYDNWVVLFYSIALIALIYLTKFCTLKFTGWITGLKEITNTYIFVIFLINKIMGIFLVPFIVILAFSDVTLVKTTILISLISIGLFLLLRFFRSYGLLQNQLKLSRFHFLLYIIGIELLPLLLIYKSLVVYFN